MYDGEEYIFLSGDLELTLSKANEIEEMNLYYELSTLDDIPPYNGADDNLGLFATIATLSASGLIVLTFTDRKRRSK